MVLKENFLKALDSFSEQIKDDPNVIALLPFGNISTSIVWEKSNINVMVITRDGSSPLAELYCLEEDDIEINMHTIELSKFKNDIQKMRNGEMWHSLYSMAIIMFSKDESLYNHFEDMRILGEDDIRRTFTSCVEDLIGIMDKAEKWVTVCDNPLYSQHFLQQCTGIVANMELLRCHEEPTREPILRAIELNPNLMNEIYVIPSVTKMTAEDVRRVLQVLDDYLMEHIDWWSKHIIKFLSDGEVKTGSHIWNSCGDAPLNYLAQKGIIQKVTTPSRVFKRSKLTVEEVAYFYIKEEDK